MPFYDYEAQSPNDNRTNPAGQSYNTDLYTIPASAVDPGLDANGYPIVPENYFYDGNQWVFIGPKFPESGTGPPPQPAYQPESSAYQPAPGPPPQPAYVPTDINYTTVPPPASEPYPLGDTTYSPGYNDPIGYGSGQSDFITPMIPALAPPPSAPAATPSGGATNAAVGVAPLMTDTGGVSTPVGDQYGGNYDSGYGTSGGYGGYGGYSSPPPPAFAPYDASLGGGRTPFAGRATSRFGAGFPFNRGQAAPVGRGPVIAGQFDPFAWAGVQNPMPPPNPMRQMILDNIGGMPAPPPPPMSPMRYVEARLGLEPESINPKPGYAAGPQALMGKLPTDEEIRQIRRQGGPGPALMPNLRGRVPGY